MAINTTKSHHIAILPSPGMGHLIPLVEFAKKLHNHHNFSSTFIIPSDGPLSTAQNNFLSSLPPPIDYLLLPPVNFDDLPTDVKIETRISLTITRSINSIHDSIKSLHQTHNLVALVVDLFGTDAFDLALEFKIPPYIFFPSNGTLLSLLFHLPKLDQIVSCEYRDFPEKLQIPGCVPIHGSDLLEPLQDRKNDAYKWVLHHSKRYKMAKGIVINSFKEVEPRTIEALEEEADKELDIYHVGPLIQIQNRSKTDRNSSVCMDWLNDQPKNSVLFVSFGSGGTLSHEQIIELAFGLETSEIRFLWVIRCPNSKMSNASYFGVEKNSSDDPFEYLPQGFLERTKGRGLVVPMWAPQAEILEHDSVCAFVTHCGWNSTLESVVNGVALIAWPLYAEQRMNAVLLHEDVKVALRPKVGEKGLVGRDEIKNVVKELMEGEEGKMIKTRMGELKDAAAQVLSENGSSTKSLIQLVNKWKQPRGNL